MNLSMRGLVMFADDALVCMSASLFSCLLSASWERVEPTLSADESGCATSHVHVVLIVLERLKHTRAEAGLGICTNHSLAHQRLWLQI